MTAQKKTTAMQWPNVRIVEHKLDTIIIPNKKEQ